MKRLLDYIGKRSGYAQRTSLHLLLEKWKRKLANSLQKRADAASTRTVKYWFVVSVVIATACNLYCMVADVRHPLRTPDIGKLNTFSPKTADEHRRKIVEAARRREIELSRLFLDSLWRDSSDQPLIRQLFRGRSGLLDSAQSIEKLPFLP